MPSIASPIVKVAASSLTLREGIQASNRKIAELFLEVRRCSALDGFEHS